MPVERSELPLVPFRSDDKQLLSRVVASRQNLASYDIGSIGGTSYSVFKPLVPKHEELSKLSNDVVVYTQATPFALPSKENAETLALLKRIPKEVFAQDESLRRTRDTVEIWEKERARREELAKKVDSKKSQQLAGQIFADLQGLLAGRPSIEGLQGWRISEEGRIADLAARAKVVQLTYPMSETSTAYRQIKITLNTLKPALGAIHLTRKPPPTITDAGQYRKDIALFRIAEARYNFWGTDTPSRESLHELTRTADEHYISGILNPGNHDYDAIGEAALQTKLNSRVRQAEINHLNRGESKRLQLIDELVSELRPTSKKAQRKEEAEIEKFIESESSAHALNLAGAEDGAIPDAHVLKLRAQIAQGKLHKQEGHREVALLAEELLDNHIQDSYTPLEAIEELLRMPDEDGKMRDIGDNDLRVGAFPVEISLKSEPFSHSVTLDKAKVLSDSEIPDAKLQAKLQDKLLNERAEIAALYKTLKAKNQRRVYLRRDGDDIYWTQQATEPNQKLEGAAHDVASKLVNRSQKYRQLRRLLLAEDQRNSEKNLVLSLYPNISERSQSIYQATASIPGAAPEKLVKSRMEARKFILEHDPELSGLATRVFAEEMLKRQS